MKIDGGLGVDSGFDGIMDKSREQEEIGYDGLWVPETSHDPFTMLPLMAEATENVELGQALLLVSQEIPWTWLIALTTFS